MVATGQVVSGGGGPHTHPWGDITGEPATFPPDAHAHPISEVTNLQTTLDGKAPAHAHPYAATVHGHAIADTAGLQTALDAATQILAWNGSAYALAATANVYVGPTDPGAVPDGSVWIDTDA